jgi:hypothetical protein
VAQAPVVTEFIEMKEQQMTESGPSGCPADGHIPDFDFGDEEDDAALVVVSEDVDSVES